MLKGAASRIGGIVLSPRETYSIMIHERRGLLEPLLLVVLFSAALGGLSGVALLGSALGMLGMQMLGPPIYSLAVYAFIGLGAVAGVVTWLIWGLLTYVFAKLLDGAGTIGDTLTVLGYSWVVYFPLLVLLLACLASPLAVGVLTAMIALVIFIWQVAVAAMGLSEAHGFSVARGVASVLLPLVVTLVICFALGLAMFMATIGGTTFTG